MTKESVAGPAPTAPDAVNLTPSLRRCAQFVADNEPVGAFPSGVPLFMVRRAEEAGLIERAGKAPGVFGFTLYRITDKGRQALASGE